MAEFRLPASSYSELTKIIKAYSSNPKGASLDDISQSTTIPKLGISKNSKFLVAAGIIEGGNQKNPTEIGMNLGRALSFNKLEEIKKYWQIIILKTDFFNKMLTALKVKGGMTKNDFIGHIEYSSGQKKTSESRAGSGAVAEILKEAELIQEENGRLVALNNLDHTAVKKEEEVVDTQVVNKEKFDEEKSGLSSSISKKVSIGQDNNITININVQLTVPETTDENVYDKFFEAMKKHLLS